MRELRVSTQVELQAGFTKLPSWLQWIGATTAGDALGMTLSTYLVSSFMRPLGPVLGGIFNVLIYGGLIGVVLGSVQYMVLPRKQIPSMRWILATLAGGDIGFTLAAIAGKVLSDRLDPTRNMVLGQGAVVAIAGVIIGLAIGFGQGLVLQRRLPCVRGWMLASVLGTTVGTVVAAVLFGIFELPLLNAAPGTSVGAIVGIFTGIFQGFIFSRSIL